MCNWGAMLTERGVKFRTGPAFYRVESTLGRDLAVLAALVYKQEVGRLNILDAMAGSGVRGARYIQQSKADFIWCNDYNQTNMPALKCNLGIAVLNTQTQNGSEDDQNPGVMDRWEKGATSIEYPGIRSPLWERRSQLEPSVSGDTHRKESENNEIVCRISHLEANSNTMFLHNAIDSLRYGGLLYLTSTDGFSSGGRRPERALAAYGAYSRPLHIANEQGLRMLIGAAVKAGSTRGRILEPLFSLYSPHGPVFRVMLRATRGRQWAAEHYGFLGCCSEHGQVYRVPWDEINSAQCRCLGKNGNVRLTLSGPMWTGPLHNTKWLQDMRIQARALDWCSGGSKAREIEDLLELLSEESQSELRPGYVLTDIIGKQVKYNPKRDDLLATLRSRGFSVARCHIEAKAIRTNATMQETLEVAQYLKECSASQRRTEAT